MPTSGLSSRFSSYSSYSSYPSYSRSTSTPSSSSYLGRTDSTSRDRSTGTSSYTSSLGSSYTPYTPYYKRSSALSTLPPRPSYSSSLTDSYKSRASTRSSPTRSSATSSYRSTLKDRDTDGDKDSSRYSYKSSRDSSTSSSRDSGYGSSSYLSSRYGSYDLPNGTSSLKKNDSVSSTVNDEEKEENVKVSDRIKSYEKPGSSYEKTSNSYDTHSYETSTDPFEDRLNERRKRLGLSPVRVSKSKSPVPPRYGRKIETSNDESLTGCSGGATSTSTYRSTYEPTVPDSLTLKSYRTRTDSNSSDTKENSGYGDRSRKQLDSPLADRRGSSPITKVNGEIKKESTPEVEENRRGSLRVSSSTAASPHNRYSWSPRSEVTTSYTIPSIRVEPEPEVKRSEPESVRSLRESTNSLTLRSRDRRDRVKDRIAARLASELDGVQTSHSTSNGTDASSDTFSEQNGLVGLRNIGNTCFLNSVTQCLSNTPPLLEYLVKEGISSSDFNTSLSGMKGDLMKAFASLLNEMWRGNPNQVRSPINTSAFKTQLQRFAPQFIGYQQHDAQEFLRKLLEGLHEDVNRVTTRSRVILDDIDDDLDDRQKAMEAWKRYLRYDDSKIVDMFVGQLMSCLRCSHCGYRSLTFDPFWDLSLPIPPHTRQVKIQQCLELFTKEEVLDGDERPTCSKCKERRRMTKCFSIQRFPKVLVLHLKRFSALERWRGKLTCNVDFPVDGLDLSSYASGVGSSGSGSYKLLGMANHSGTSHSGHYTAYCKHPYKGQWNEYNDSRVSNIASHRVCSPEAYVLFYELKY